MTVKFTNRATTLLASSINNSVTSLSVTASSGSKFPALGAGEWFPVVVVAADGSYEIMRATARAGDVITVTRAQEGTAAQSFNAGSRVDLRLTNAAITAMLADAVTEAEGFSTAAIAAAIAPFVAPPFHTGDIADAAITYAKLQNATAAGVLGASAAGAHVLLALGPGVSTDGGTLTIAPALPRGYIDGCILSNNVADPTNDIDIAAGVCRDSTNSFNIDIGAQTKQLDANWVSGTSGGMRNSAAGIADGTYHLWAARTAASSTATIYAHTSAVAATVLAALQAESGGASYVYARRLGSIIRESNAIAGFVQDGDYFRRKTSVLDVDVTNPGTAAVSRALSVPNGIRVEADLLIGGIESGSNNPFNVLFSDLSTTDETPTTTNGQGVTIYNQTGSAGNVLTADRVWTNTLRQVRTRMDVSDSTNRMLGRTRGWRDLRGKDA